MRNNFLSEINIQSEKNDLLNNIRTTKNKSLLLKLKRNFIEKLFWMQLKINIIIEIDFKIIQCFFSKPIMNTIFISKFIEVILNIGHLQPLLIHIDEDVSDIINNVRVKDDTHNHIDN